MGSFFLILLILLGCWYSVGHFKSTSGATSTSKDGFGLPAGLQQGTEKCPGSRDAWKEKNLTALASQREYNDWDMPEDCTANSSSASSDSSKRALAQGPVPREPCLSPKIGGPQSVFFSWWNQWFCWGIQYPDICHVFCLFFLHHVEVAMVQSCTREWFVSRSTTETNESGYNSGPQLIIAHYGGKYSRTGFKNQICLWLQIATKLCPLSTPDHRISSAHTGEHGEHGELSQRTEILRSVRTPSNAAGTNDFLPNSSSASGRPGGESVPEFAKFSWEKTGGLSIEVSDFYYKNKRKVMV